MSARLLVILAVIMWLISHGCSEGTLDIEFGDEEFNSTPSVNDGNNNTATPIDTGTPEDTNSEDEQEEIPDCCDPNEVECTGEEEYRFCDPVGDFCGHWTEPMDCPTGFVCDPTVAMDDPCDPLCTENHPDWGEPCSSGDGICEEQGTLTECDGEVLVCDAVPGEPEPEVCNGLDNNCDGVVDSGDVCNRCLDDDFGPENHSYDGAPELAVGGEFNDLILCDNEAAPASRNWFYLGETDNIHLQLDWEAGEGPLGLEIRIVPDFGFPQEFDDAGEGSPPLTYQKSLDEIEEAYAVVYFRTDDKPVTGTPYDLTRPN